MRETNDISDFAFPNTTPDQDPVVAHFDELDARESVLWALSDDTLSADDGDRLVDVRDIAAAHVEYARRRVETTPPRSLRGLALQINYAFQRTDSTAAASALRSCLIALVGEADMLVPPADEVATLELVDDAFILGLEDPIFDGRS